MDNSFQNYWQWRKEHSKRTKGYSFINYFNANANCLIFILKPVWPKNQDLNQISLVSKIKKVIYLVTKLMVGLNFQNQEIFMIFKRNLLENWTKKSQIHEIVMFFKRDFLNILFRLWFSNVLGYRYGRY